MAKLIMLSGLPASGKSTKAKEITEQGNWYRVNRDLLRTMLHCDKFTGRNEGITVDVEKYIVKALLNAGKNVVVDDTNLNPKNKAMWRGIANESGANFEYTHISTPVEECVSRDVQRIDKAKVGETVIKKMALQYLDYMKGERVVICDLDGTICDISHRLHFVKGVEKKDWKGFFGAIPQDLVRQEVVEKLLLAIEDGEKVIFVSARPEDYREDTERWLLWNLHDYRLVNYSLLIMRESHDGRPDTEVKGDIYEKYLKNLDIVKIFDDRPSVIRMWREKGLEVEDVGAGVEF